MSELEKIQSYIEKTKFTRKVRGIYPDECIAIATSADDIIKVIALAFKFGCAKGYRAGKKAAKNE